MPSEPPPAATIRIPTVPVSKVPQLPVRQQADSGGGVRVENVRASSSSSEDLGFATLQEWNKERTQAAMEEEEEEEEEEGSPVVMDFSQWQVS